MKNIFICFIIFNCTVAYSQSFDKYFTETFRRDKAFGIEEIYNAKNNKNLNPLKSNTEDFVFVYPRINETFNKDQFLSVQFVKKEGDINVYKTIAGSNKFECEYYVSKENTIISGTCDVNHKYSDSVLQYMISIRLVKPVFN